MSDDVAVGYFTQSGRFHSFRSMHLEWVIIDDRSASDCYLVKGLGGSAPTISSSRIAPPISESRRELIITLTQVCDLKWPEPDVLQKAAQLLEQLRFGTHPHDMEEIKKQINEVVGQVVCAYSKII